MENLNIRQVRLAKEITIEQMADALGVHPNTYANWEKNPLSITIGNAFKIANILSVSVDSIFLACDSTKC